MLDNASKKAPQEKDHEGKAGKEEVKIKFNLNKDYLSCFISSKSQLYSKDIAPTKILSSEKTIHKPAKPHSPQLLQLTTPLMSRKAKHNFQLTPNIFNNKLLMMDYGQTELYIDSTKLKNRQNSDSNSPKNVPEDAQDEFVKSCVRVITEETDNTSNPVSARFSIPETYPYYGYQDYSQRERVRNRRSVSSEESGLFKIDLCMIEKDGRTTLMLRNIPNKYTRDMIVSQIDACNFKKKYDFFYLPIDYRNQCNVGYAFINFIHTKFIQEFYEKFHHKRWQKFNSEKICQVCYARIQGTAQLMNHFKDSTVIHQKDKKLRPIMDMNYSSLAEMVQRQKSESGRFENGGNSEEQKLQF